MRIVHFSDIHVGCFPSSLSAFADKRILGAANFLLRRWYRIRSSYVARAAAEIQRLQPEWVVCTGDITTVGTPVEFKKALELLRPIRKLVGGRFIYVPGNHDAYVRDQSCQAALASTFAELNDGRWSLADLPVACLAGGVRLIVVNEALPSGCFFSTGLLSESDQRKLDSFWTGSAGADHKSVLISHFPARNGSGQPLGKRRRLKGAEWIHRALLDGRLAASLCGHVHHPFVRQEQNGALEICAGSLTMAGFLSVLDYLPAKGRFAHFWVDVSGNSSIAPQPVGRELPAPS